MGWRCEWCTFENAQCASLRCAVCLRTRSERLSGSSSIVVDLTESYPTLRQHEPDLETQPGVSSCSSDDETRFDAETAILLEETLQRGSELVTAPNTVLIRELFTKFSCDSMGRTPTVTCDLGNLTFISQYPDTFSCGFRSLQMLIASILALQNLSRVLFCGAGVVPTVAMLQRWIELAWRAGFDSEGVGEDRALIGTSKWIGVVDSCALLRFFGIDARLIDFDFPPGNAQSRGQSIIARVADLLAGARQGSDSPPVPVVLQYSGHAVVVFGVAYATNGVGENSLLHLNPRWRPEELLESLLTLADHAHTISDGLQPLPSKLYLAASQLKRKQYQVLYVGRLTPMSATEREDSKLIRSERIA